jgi:hypothetical protein
MTSPLNRGPQRRRPRHCNNWIRGHLRRPRYELARAVAIVQQELRRVSGSTLVETHRLGTTPPEPEPEGMMPVPVPSKVPQEEVNGKKYGDQCILVLVWVY